MLRTRILWMISIVAIIATVIIAMVGVSSLPAARAQSNRPQTYLALGDSVAFGYDPLVIAAGRGGDASNFIGYPTPVSTALKETLFNAACPGETSSHFIDTSLSDNNCGSFRANFPLHVSYAGSQMQYADTFLKSNPQTLVVSLNMGTNDLFVLIGTCGGEANTSCILGGLQGMLDTLKANLNTIYGHIRNEDGYHHKIVALTYYTRNFSDPVGVYIITQLNNAIADRTRAFGGLVADGFGAFAAATAPYGGDTCKAGLIIVTSQDPLTCDDHPSPAGRNLLAQTIVNTLRAD